jgi:hypothetical protein
VFKNSPSTSFVNSVLSSLSSMLLYKASYLPAQSSSKGRQEVALQDCQIPSLESFI